MIRATRHAESGHWPAPPHSHVTLDYDSRHRRRIRLTASTGEAVLLDLPKAVAMAEGDGLQLTDGRWIAIRAADEPVMDITCDDPLQLMRIAWHVGNRHLPTDIAVSDRGSLRLRLRSDHVIADMIAGLGGTVRHLEAPFQPERGAYHQHHHHHSHDRTGHAAE